MLYANDVTSANPPHDQFGNGRTNSTTTSFQLNDPTWPMTNRVLYTAQRRLRFYIHIHTVGRERFGMAFTSPIILAEHCRAAQNTTPTVLFLNKKTFPQLSQVVLFPCGCSPVHPHRECTFISIRSNPPHGFVSMFFSTTG